MAKIKKVKEIKRSILQLWTELVVEIPEKLVKKRNQTSAHELSSINLPIDILVRFVEVTSEFNAQNLGSSLVPLKQQSRSIGKATNNSESKEPARN